jgi:hypothetical protein
MSTVVTIGLAIAALALIYFLSSGVAFVLMYRIGERFPAEAASWLYTPLEWLSQHSRVFRYLYNGLHAQMYRLCVGELKGGWAPPPPNIARALEDADKEKGG